MKAKLILVLFGLLLLLPIAQAANPPFVLNVSTSNGSVTLKDPSGDSETFGCVSKPDGAPQQFRFDGRTTYDITAEDLKPYLTNVSCSVANLECKIPDEKLAKIEQSCISSMGLAKEELKNTLPGAIISQANISGWIELNGDLQGKDTRIEILNDRIGDVTKQRDLLAVLAIGAMLGIIAILIEEKTGKISKLFPKKVEG